jgi:hypothetical protein
MFYMSQFSLTQCPKLQQACHHQLQLRCSCSFLLLLLRPQLPALVLPALRLPALRLQAVSELRQAPHVLWVFRGVLRQALNVHLWGLDLLRPQVERVRRVQPGKRGPQRALLKRQRPARCREGECVSKGGWKREWDGGRRNGRDREKERERGGSKEEGTGEAWATTCLTEEA